MAQARWLTMRAGIGNLVTGDAPRRYLTMATIAARPAADDARRLCGFFVSTVNYLRLFVLMVGAGDSPPRSTDPIRDGDRHDKIG